jgi:hypothetical protein
VLRGKRVHSDPLKLNSRQKSQSVVNRRQRLGFGRKDRFEQRDALFGAGDLTPRPKSPAISFQSNIRNWCRYARTRVAAIRLDSMFTGCSFPSAIETPVTAGGGSRRGCDAAA